MGASSSRERKYEAKASASQQFANPTLKVKLDGSKVMGLLFEKSDLSGDELYSRRVVKKLWAAQKGINSWNDYHVRKGTVVQFVDEQKEPLGAPVPVKSLKVQIVTSGNDAKEIDAVIVQSLQGLDRKTIQPPGKKAETESRSVERPSPVGTDAGSSFIPKPLANYEDIEGEDNEVIPETMRAKHRGTGVSHAAPLRPSPRGIDGRPSWARPTDRTSASSAGAAETTLGEILPQKQQWEWLQPSDVVDQQLTKLLNGMSEEVKARRKVALMEQERKKKRSSINVEAPTKFDDFRRTALQKGKGKEAPLSMLLQAQVHPDYLQLPHKNTQAALDSQMLAFEILQRAALQGSGQLKKFAEELLERTGYKQEEVVGVVASNKKSLAELLTKFTDSKTSSSVQANLINNHLEGVIGDSITAMSKMKETGKKVVAVQEMRKVIEAAKQSTSRSEVNGLSVGKRSPEKNYAMFLAPSQAKRP